VTSNHEGTMSEETLLYRSARPADAHAVATLHADNWRRAYRGNFRDEYLDGDVYSERQRVWEARLGQPPAHQFVLVAEAEGRILGFVCAFGAHDPEWGSFVDNLQVAEGARGRGIGTALMRRTGAWLASRFPDDPVHLLVWEKNPARALYERLGGRNTGLVEAENPGGGVGRYFRMAWDRPDGLVP